MLHLADYGGPLLGRHEAWANLVLGATDNLLLLLRLIEARNRNVIKLRKFLLDKIHNVAVHLILQTSRRLQSVCGRLDILVDEHVDAIAAFLDVFELAFIDADFLAQAGLVADEKLRPFVETFYVNHEIFCNVENVLEFV